MDEQIKKKRGRKPKNNFYENVTVEEPVVIVDKKKRGRKKKYEIENFDKIIHRDEINNFNHNIVYSDDEELSEDKKNSIKQISFGNLNITISKKVQETCPAEDVIQFKSNIKNSLINENEWESDEEKEIPMETIVNCEKHYNTTQKYTTNEITNEPCIKKIRVVTCLKNTLPNLENDWPEKTDVACWWCCHKFDTCPCTLPTKHDPLRKRFTFIGIFCSWNCTKSYNFNMSDHKKYERSSIITLLIQQLYGVYNAINIKAAPPRQSLKMFGGYLSIDEFRSNSSTVDSYSINEINRVFVYPEITETSNVKIKSEKKNYRISRS